MPGHPESRDSGFTIFSREKAVQALHEAMSYAKDKQAIPSPVEYEQIRALLHEENEPWMPTANQILEAYGGKWPESLE